MKLIKKGQDGLKTMHPYGPMYLYMSEYYKDFGIGNHPDFDEDFRSTYGLRYAPYDEIDFSGVDPSNIRLQNLDNVTAQSFLWENPKGTLLVGPDNKIINKERLAELSRLYREDNAQALNKRYSTLKGEKPILPVAPEFWLLTAGATKAPSTLNSVISPLFNMLATDNIISDITPYKGWGNMMSKNVGGQEWAWDIAHPAFTKDLWNLTKYGTRIGSLYVKDAAVNTTFNILDNNVSRIVKIPQVKRGIEVLAKTDESLIPDVYMDFIKRLSQTLEGRQQLKANGKYILTGRSTEGVPYRTLNPNGIETNGFTLSTDFPEGKTDLLDVYFYGKQLDDDVLTYLGKGPEADFGIHTDYVNRFYPDRAKNILVYETLPREFNVKQGEVLLQNPGTYIRGLLDFLPHMFTLDGRCAVDVGGHLLLVDPNLKAWQYLDIWKFNPEEYIKSWGNQWTNNNRWTYLGLKFMDKAGTPIITRTPIYYGTKLPH